MCDISANKTKNKIGISVLYIRGQVLQLFLFLFPLILYPQDRIPVSLREDIQVEHFMSVGPECVRILQDPIHGNLWYTTFSGGVFEVMTDYAANPYAVQRYTLADHEISRLQGAVFLDSTLILVGNISVNNDKGTKGIMKRARLGKDNKRSWSTVFITEEVGGTKTIFDHGFNGLAISPDQQYFFVNSGARTDHGEIQDNDGLYPGSRDEPLTACILRIPVDAEAMILLNDMEFLKKEGLLYADGIRNAYDIAFSPDGQLFAVSNSSDYDHPDEMFWIREGYHYGFPWIMGGEENPQQYPDYQPDPKTDPFINPFSAAYRYGYLKNDPEFPPRPQGVTFFPSIQNLGPDANLYRDRSTGKVMDADTTDRILSTFTPHRSPLGLFFDQDSILSEEFRGDGFVLSWTSGKRFPLMIPFGPHGEDLIHMKLSFNPSLDNYQVHCYRIVENFDGPTDAVMIGNEVYVISYNAGSGDIWKITFPTSPTPD